MTKEEKKVYNNPDIECLRHHLENGFVSLMEAARTVNDLYYRGSLAFDQANIAIRLLAKVKVSA